MSIAPQFAAHPATTLGDLLVRAATEAPDRMAVVTPRAIITYQGLLDRARRVARGLVGLGVKAQSNVGIFAPNGIPYLEALFAVHLVGATAVPINVRHRTSELRFIVTHADLDVVLTTTEIDDYSDLGAVLTEALPGASIADDPSDLQLEGCKLRSVVLLDGHGKPGTLARHNLEDLAGRVTDPEVDALRIGVQPSDLAVILYTSGTTAHPKGCMLSHDALTRGPVDRARKRFRTAEDHDVFWIPGPMFHVGALSPYVCCLAATGTVLTDEYFDAGRALKLMRLHGVTSGWPWFPVITSAVLDHPDFDPSALSSLRYLGQVGPRSLFDRLRETLPETELIKSSGMTETAGSFGLSSPDERFEERVIHQGEPVRDVEVKVVDPVSEDELPRGSVGHLLVRGYCVTSGYYGEPELTEQTIDEDGWLRTGDLYSHTARGKLNFHGRHKDMLRVGGENVAPLELEEFLCDHPAVETAAVVGQPDDRLDEVPVAFVELRPDAVVESQDLIDFCRGQIASFKVPRAVHFVRPGEWPVSATKIDKRALRDRVRARPEQKD